MRGGWSTSESLFERFVRCTRITDSCWLWEGALIQAGYGHFNFQGKTYKAHRVGFELFKGPIPVGLEPDHLCRNRACVNPAHLEAVTHQENTRRGFVARGSKCTHGFPRKRDCYDCREVYRQRYEATR